MDRPSALLDAQNLKEIVNGFLAGTTVIPSDKLVRALAACCRMDEAAVRLMFDERAREQGAETSLFDTMLFSGSG
jgi:hypothetical protein